MKNLYKSLPHRINLCLLFWDNIQLNQDLHQLNDKNWNYNKKLYTFIVIGRVVYFVLYSHYL